MKRGEAHVEPDEILDRADVERRLEGRRTDEGGDEDEGGAVACVTKIARDDTNQTTADSMLAPAARSFIVHVCAISREPYVVS